MQQIELNRRRVMRTVGEDESKMPLTFIAEEPTDISLEIPADVKTTDIEYVEYSLDNGRTWVQTYNADNTSVTMTIPTLQAKKSVFVRGKAKAYTETTNYRYAHFVTTGLVKAKGNIMSLLNKDFETLDRVQPYAFYKLFDSTKITTPPLLPATLLDKGCYQYMFSGCTYLTVAPELPATTLARDCYANCFYNCENLVESPILRAETLVQGCYKGMFTLCVNLQHITMLATDVSASSCLSNWVSNVAATGTFIKNPAMTTLPTGNSGIPSGWTVQDYPN